MTRPAGPDHPLIVSHVVGGGWTLGDDQMVGGQWLDLSSFKGNAPDQVLPAVTNDFLFHFLFHFVTAGTWMGDNFLKEAIISSS